MEGSVLFVYTYPARGTAAFLQAAAHGMFAEGIVLSRPQRLSRACGERDCDGALFYWARRKIHGQQKECAD